MATIVVEGIPDGLLARLRLAADGSGRSLSREVVVQLARSVACSQEAPRADTQVAGARSPTGRDCHCVTRRVEARTIGWGGSS